jgi:hypothetical protein
VHLTDGVVAALEENSTAMFIRLTSSLARRACLPAAAGPAAAVAARQQSGGFGGKQDLTKAMHQKKGGDDFSAMGDDEFWFLDEMMEGFMDSPDFLPREEQELLKREFAESKEKK